MYYRILNKLLHSIYLTFAWLSAKYLFMVIKSPTEQNGKKKILAIPFYPKHYAGGHERIGDWKEAVEEIGTAYHVHWTYDESFYRDYFLSQNPLKKYWFYFTVTLDRIKTAKKFYLYDAIWIQRAFIPLFPFSYGLFEKELVKHGNIVYDFYDADYESNFDLVIDTIKSADKVSVASPFLLDFCKKYNEKSYYIPFSFNYHKYPIKKYDTLDKITIGWAGSQSNFNNIKKIAKQLVKLENEYSNINFLFVCRDKTDLGLKRITQICWGDDGFDYLEAMGSIDLGINPMLEINDRTKAKVSFKCLEYMSLGIAFATSPYGIPQGLNTKDSCEIVNEENAWYDNLSNLVKNKSAFRMLGENARRLIESDFDYKKNANLLVKILLN